MSKLLQIAKAALGLCIAGSVFAQDAPATQAEAAERLKGIIAAVKAKGAAAAAQDIMSPADPLKCKYKDMVCLLIKIDTATFLVNTALPKMVGQQFPADMVDVDGSPIIAAQLNPAKQGKTKWDAKYKFARPDTKKITPRWSFCEKADDAHVACAVVSQ